MSGKKYDQEKPDISLIPSTAIRQEAEVFTFGKTKYGAHNWREGINFSRLYSAVQRHLIAWNEGEDLDPESGLSHLAHARCGIAMLIENISYGRKKLDDRYKKGS